MITRRLTGMVCCAVALVAAGCGSGTASGAAGNGNSASEDKGSGTHAQQNARAESCAARAFRRLTAAERVGQLFLVGIPVPGAGASSAGASSTGAPSTGTVRANHFGSVLFVGNTTAGVAQVRALTDQMQRLAPAGVAMFVAANQEGGEIQPLRGQGFDPLPSATVQGAMPVAALRASAIRWGHQLILAGVNLNLAPVLDTVPRGTESTNAPIGALQREYGDSPRTVSGHGVAFIDGMRAAGVATTAKHFPGLGRVRGNTDFTADVTDTQTTTNDLATYQAAIDAKVPFVMVALARYTRIDGQNIAAFSAAIVTGLLKERMGFGGVVVSDDLGAAAVAGLAPAARAEAFLDAGGDMLTEQSADVAAQMAPAVLHKTATDRDFRNRVDDAVMKILAAKAEYGLLAC